MSDRLRTFAPRVAVAAALLAMVGASIYLRHEKRQAQRELAQERAAAACERARGAQKRGDYNAAREGYLAALAVDRNHADARAALVQLTAEGGATDEARHHLAELGKIVAPQDARLEQARSLLAGR